MATDITTFIFDQLNFDETALYNFYTAHLGKKCKRERKRREGEWKVDGDLTGGILKLSLEL